MTATAPAAPRSLIDRLLSTIERVGNALPHPATLFASLAALVVLASGVAAQFDLSVTHPATGEVVRPVSLLSIDGLHRILTGLVKNFAGFAPLGTVLVSLIGIAVAEHSGMIQAGLRALVLGAPKKLLTVIVVFAGVLSNTASEIGYVLLVPLAGIMFQAAGRHPIVGMAAAFAGVSGGYSANLFPGTIDPLLAGLSQEGAQIVNPTYEVGVLANYYFMITSTFLITVIGTLVTEKVVAPRFNDTPTASGGDQGVEPLSTAERRGLVWALVTFAIILVIVAIGLIPSGGFLRDVATDSVLKSPVLSGVVAMIFIIGVSTGIAYGIGAGTIKSDADVIDGMGKSMSTLGSYIVLVFFAAQFVAFFNWTNLGLILAVEGAETLGNLGLPSIPLFLGFILLTAVVNLFMGSASAKWALMAPVFVPMFMLLGYSPEVTQAAYRVGDSVTNIISPMMSYFVLIIAFMQRYEPKAGMGTIISVMLPYSIAFGIAWSILFSIWLAMGWPFGPGAPLEYVAGG
ncbi:MAG: AbgT family transporter [Lysobacterales bacterium]